MTYTEKKLLLTVARILRARISKEVYADQSDDLIWLNDALSPFDGVPVNSAS